MATDGKIVFHDMAHVVKHVPNQVSHGTHSYHRIESRGCRAFLTLNNRSEAFEI
jgi:hypothetical protein